MTARYPPNENLNASTNSMKNTFNNLKFNTLPKAENKIKEKLDEMTPVLTNSQLKNLHAHKYSSTGKTLFDPIFQPYWEWLVLQMPIYLAPNLITVIGLIINVVTSTILIFYSPNGKEPVPAWSFFLCGLGLFIYQSLDAIDGKQARRTKSSTPLGELFDHGCDAISTELGQYPCIMFLTIFLAMSAFYTAHWQTYVTGTLKFGTIDVTEAQVAIVIVHFMSGLFGESLWSMTIPFTNFEFRFAPVICGLLGSIVSIVENIKIISGGGKGKHGSTVADTSIVFPGFPLLLFIFMAFSIANKSPSIYLTNSCLYSLTFGVVWAKFTVKLIIAHMTKGEIFLFDTCLIGPVALLLNQYFSYIIPELIVLVASLIIATFDFIKYCTKVCFQICTFLDIHLFKIKPENYNQAILNNNNAH